MSTYLTSYRPSVHGFRFANRPSHQQVGPVSIRGCCNGMCQVSLDYFHAGRATPTVDVVDDGLLPISGLGVASWSPDRVDLFVRRDSDRVATKHLQGGRFSDWHDLTSSQSSLSPAAASCRPDRIDVVVRGLDGRLWHQWYDKGWTGAAGICRPLPAYPEDLGHPEDLGVVFDSSPAVAMLTANRLAVYARGGDGDLWWKDYDTRWRAWASLGRPEGITLISDPAATGQPGWMTVLVSGSDNAVWQKEYAEGRWLPWRSLGGVAASGPAVASPFLGRAEVYVLGEDRKLHLNVWSEGGWDGWRSLGAPPPGLSDERPAAVSHDGVMDVYALTCDHTVWHKRWSNGWRPWQSTDVPATATSRALTDAICARSKATTITPLLATNPVSPATAATLGTAARFVQQLAYSDDQLLNWASTDEMWKVLNVLGAGSPISIGLLGPGALGHEVVVYGGDIEPGGRSTLLVYDPNYPGCDEMTIVVDPASGTITSASGEAWRSLWVRDDIECETPPV
jgi:hypothetical protein